MKSDVVYTLRARAQDRAGNYSSIIDSITFTYDIDIPTVTISKPLNNVHYSTFKLSTPIAGTSGDSGVNPTGVSTVTVAIRDVDGGANVWFNGTSFVSAGGALWLGINGGTVSDWKYYSSTLTFTNDHRYEVHAKSQDNAGNTSIEQSVTFKYDVIKPTTTIKLPAPGYVTSLTLITGTADDDPMSSYNFESGLGTWTVTIAIKQTDTLWWDGDAFSGPDPVYFECQNDTNTTIWQYNTSGIGFLTSKSYRIISRATDLASNAEFGTLEVDIPSGVGITINFDNDQPTAKVTFPQGPMVSSYNVTAMTVIKGTSIDNTSGVKQVKIIFKRSGAAGGEEHVYWDGLYPGDFSSGIKRIIIPDNTGYLYLSSWTINCPELLSNRLFRVWVEVFDNAGNKLEISDSDITSNLAPSQRVDFRYDNDVPTTILTKPTPNTAVPYILTTVSGTALDGIGSAGIAEGMGKVRLWLNRSGGDYFNGITWQIGRVFLEPEDVTVIDETYKRYRWIKSIADWAWEDGYQYGAITRAEDLAGNIGAEVTNYFIIDFTTPTTKVIIPENNSWIKNISVLSGTADDSVENLRGYSESGRTYESNIKIVGVSLQRLSDNKWFSGTDFGPSEP
ncbi:hypothetical protein COY52_12865, partial [Candidatus Desantisbacteria bacterium CG_4_10_14_0_8_um_filter_48_22]